MLQVSNFAISLVLWLLSYRLIVLMEQKMCLTVSPFQIEAFINPFPFHPFHAWNVGLKLTSADFHQATA